MLALASVWIGLASLILAATMVLYRPAMTDNTIPIVLWAGSPGAICLAGLVLWASRKIDHPDPGLVSQRLQAKVAITTAIVPPPLAYLLTISSPTRAAASAAFAPGAPPASPPPPASRPRAPRPGPSSAPPASTC